MAGRKIDAMHWQYGQSPHRCKECIHFRRDTYHGRTYFKCWAYGWSHADSTDWRAGWIACGLFNQPLSPQLYVPMIERIKREGPKKRAEQIEGQIGLEEVGTYGE